MIGTEAIRRGWRIRPHKVRLRVGRPLTFPRVARPSQQLAAAVTDRIWPCVMLQWEWLGGLPPLRRAAIIGAGSWGTATAVMLARAGIEVELGCRTAEQAEALARTRVNERYLPGVGLPEGVHVSRAADLGLAAQDLVCFAVPSRDLPAAVAAHGGEIPSRAGVLVLAKGLVPAARRPARRLRRRAHPGAGDRRASPVPATPPTRWPTAPRSYSPRSTRPSRARSATRSPPPASTFTAPPT